MKVPRCAKHFDDTTWSLRVDGRRIKRQKEHMSAGTSEPRKDAPLLQEFADGPTAQRRLHACHPIYQKRDGVIV